MKLLLYLLNLPVRRRKSTSFNDGEKILLCAVIKEKIIEHGQCLRTKNWIAHFSAELSACCFILFLQKYQDTLNKF